MVPLSVIIDAGHAAILKPRQTQYLPPPPSDPSGGASAPILVATFGAVALFVCAISCSVVLRGARARRRQRERDLLEQEIGWTASRGAGVDRRRDEEGEGEQEYPVMYEVCLERKNYKDREGGPCTESIEWKIQMPLSTSLIRLPPSRSKVSPHRWQGVRDRLRALRQSKYPSSPPLPTNTPPSPQSVVTSVLIAMPIPPEHNYPSESLPSATISKDAAMPANFQKIPEMLFGVHEVPVRS